MHAGLTATRPAENLRPVSTFARATQLAPLGSGEHAVEIDGSWMQGRGVYGGLAAAILCRALEAEARAGQASEPKTGAGQ